MRVYLIYLVFFTSCSTQWVSRMANDRRTIISNSYNEVRQAYLFDKLLVLDAHISTHPEEFEEKFGGDKKLCFLTNKDFSNGLGPYIEGKKDRKYYCFEKEDKDLLKAPKLRKVKNLENSILIPELNIAIGGLSRNKAATSLCDCANLKGLKAKVKSAFGFSKYIFYIELSDGRWIRFSKGKRNPILNRFKAKFSSEKEFLKEKRRKYQLVIHNLERDGGYLLLRLSNFKNMVFYSKKLNYSGHSKLGRVIFSKSTIQGTKEEKGNKAYYALMPLTVVLDIVTFPIQAIIFAVGISDSGAGKQK